MKRLFTIIACSIALAAFSTSCQKCAVCTSVSDDPASAGETLESEICGRGKAYDDQITIYERGAWTCEAK